MGAHRYQEFARAGAVNHDEEDHLVAKLSEVLKYHLSQKFDMLAEKEQRTSGCKSWRNVKL